MEKKFPKQPPLKWFIHPTAVKGEKQLRHMNARYFQNFAWPGYVTSNILVNSFHIIIWFFSPQGHRADGRW